MGYETLTLSPSEQDNVKMVIGREVPTTMNKNIKYTFPVAYVKDESFFVLKGWGTFLVEKIDDLNTRLIIRTHGIKDKLPENEMDNFIFEPMHFLMERRMFLGIQAKAQNNADLINYSRYDVLWFVGIILSLLGIIFLMFRSKHIIVVCLSLVYSITWLFVLFILNPLSYFSLGLCLCVWLTYMFSGNKSSKKDDNTYFLRKKNNW